MLTFPTTFCPSLLGSLLLLLSQQGKKFLLSDYNRDGDSHRSPWNNKYVPAVDDGFLPSVKLREMEVEANMLFDSYRELYFDGGNSSVYLYLGEVSERVVDVAHGRSDMIRVPASTYMPWCALSICT